MDLNGREIEKAKFTFSIYDFMGNDRIDAVNLGDALRALDLNPSLKLIKKLGGTNRKGEKELTLEEFLPIYSDARKDKDVGNIEDYLECLKLYDKDGDGHMMANQLNHILLSYGEKLDSNETEFILRDCSDPPDEEGLIKYVPFLKRVTGGPQDALTKGTPGVGGLTEEDCMLFDRIPAASFAARPSIAIAVAVEPSEEEEEPPSASFTLKAPKK